MRKQTIAMLVILVCGAVALSAARGAVESPMEYRFVEVRSEWSKNAEGETIHYTKKAELVANELSHEGWRLSSTTMGTPTEADRVLVMAFERPASR